MTAPAYPAHVSHLLSQLRLSDVPGDLLLTYRPLLRSDTSLFSAFITLGFEHSSGTFKQPVQLQDALAVIKKEYEGPVKAGGIAGSLVPNSILIGPSPRLAFKWLSPSPLLGGLPSTADYGENDDCYTSLMWADEPEMFQGQELTLSIPSPPRPKISGLVDVSLDPLNSRMHRGLKVLSTRVREVVKGEGLITYKQVADRLMTEEEVVEAGGQKEEKNVRRRVYDALNVLIAAGVLKKQGKYVSWRVEPPRKLTKRSKAVSKQLQEQVQDAQARVIARADTLRDLVRKLTLLQALMVRNQEAPATSEKLVFPLLLMATADIPDNSMTLISSPQGRNLTVKFRNEIRILGEVDVIPLMGLNPIGLESVPKEVQRLLDTYKETNTWG